MDSIKKGESLEILRARIFEKLERTTQTLHGLTIPISEKLEKISDELEQMPEKIRGQIPKLEKGEALPLVWLTGKIREELETIETREELEKMSDELDKLAQTVEALAFKK